MESDVTEYRARYRTTDNSARFPFGHGLTYADFILENLRLSDTALRWNDTIEVRARLTNRSTRRASEVVQLYIRDRVASRTRPIRELKGIKRVTLNGGKSTFVRFSLSRRDLQFIAYRNEVFAEPGVFDIWVGPSSEGGLHAQFTLYADVSNRRQS